MMLKNKNLLGLVLGVIISISAVGQEQVRPVITGAPFLQLTPDARAGGMGELGVATLGDTYSQFHNPAKYLFLEAETRGGGVSYLPQHAGFATDIFMGSAVYFQRLGDRAALSASLTYFSFGKVEFETQHGNEFISQGSYVPNELALDVAYSLRLSDHFGMAVTGRYIRSDIADAAMNNELQLQSAGAVAADISGFYTSGDSQAKHYTFGFALKNLGSKLNYSEQDGYSYPLPTSLEVGGGYHFPMGSTDLLSLYGQLRKFLVPAVDDAGRLPNGTALGDVFASFGDAPGGFAEEWKELIYGLGAEYAFGNLVQLRTGYAYQHREKGARNHLSLGVGLKWEQFLFDFAYQNPMGSTPIKQNNALRVSIGVEL